MYQVRKGCLGLSCSLACPKMQNFTQFLLHWALVSQKMTTSLSISTQTHPFPFPDPSHPAPQGPQVLKPPRILGSSPRKVFLPPGSVWVLILWPAGSPHHWKTRGFSFLLWPWVVHFDPELYSAPSALLYPVAPSHAACMRGRRKSCPCLASPSPSLTLPALVVTPDSSAPMPPVSQTISPIPAVNLSSFSRPAQDALCHLLDQVPSPPSLSTHPRSSSVPCGADSNRTTFQKARGVLLVWWLFLFSLAQIRTEYSCRSVLRRS